MLCAAKQFCPAKQRAATPTNTRNTHPNTHQHLHTSAPIPTFCHPCQTHQYLHKPAPNPIPPSRMPTPTDRLHTHSNSHKCIHTLTYIPTHPVFPHAHSHTFLHNSIPNSQIPTHIIGSEDGQATCLQCCLFRFHEFFVRLISLTI